MPKTKLQDSIVNPEALKKQIEKRLVDIDMYQKDAAKSIGMPQRTFSEKMNTGRWTYKELFDLFTAIKLPNETILKVFGRN